MERCGSEGDESTRCPLCGEANRCARAEAFAAVQNAVEPKVLREERGTAQVADPLAATTPCWCFERRFPAALLARARARDAGRACVCAACLAEALRLEGGPADGLAFNLPVLR